jgi:polyhydroxyalkanoate synthesis regulator phasin
MLRDAIMRYVEAAQSVTDIPRERAERIARRLASSSLIDRGQIRGVTSDLVERSRENRRRLTDFVAGEIKRQLSRVGFASKNDVERLRQRVQALEIAERRNRQSRAKETTGTRKPATRARKPATRGRKAAGTRRKPASAR